jgi:hypothetical protein
MMETIRREGLAELNIVLNCLGSCRGFDEAEHVLHKRTHRVFDLTPEGWLGVDHLCIHVSNQPSRLDNDSTYDLDRLVTCRFNR